MRTQTSWKHSLVGNAAGQTPAQMQDQHINPNTALNSLEVSVYQLVTTFTFHIWGAKPGILCQGNRLTYVRVFPDFRIPVYSVQVRSNITTYTSKQIHAHRMSICEASMQFSFFVANCFQLSEVSSPPLFIKQADSFKNKGKITVQPFRVSNAKLCSMCARSRLTRLHNNKPAGKILPSQNVMGLVSVLAISGTGG